MTEKDLHRNLSSVRDIRTVLLHFSPVDTKPAIENSRSKRSLHYPLTRTTQQTSQIQTAVQDEVSVGSERPGVIAKDLFKSPHFVSCES